MFVPSVFMDWMRFMRWAQSRSDGQRIPQGGHVADRDVSAQRAMSESITVERKGVLDFIVAEILDGDVESCVRDID